MWGTWENLEARKGLGKHWKKLLDLLAFVPLGFCAFVPLCLWVSRPLGLWAFVPFGIWASWPSCLQGLLCLCAILDFGHLCFWVFVPYVPSGSLGLCAYVFLVFWAFRPLCFCAFWHLGLCAFVALCLYAFLPLCLCAFVPW